MSGVLPRVPDVVPELGPTAAVDLDNDGVQDTLVAVYVITGRAFIQEYTEPSPPYIRTFRLEMDPFLCTTDGYARIKIRFVNMLHPSFDRNDEDTWVDKTLPALRIDGHASGSTVGSPPVLNINTYRDINQTGRIDPIYGTVTDGGIKVFSDPGGIREIAIRTSYMETISEDLILMATQPNTPAGTNVTANLNNGSVFFSKVGVPGNTFIIKKDAGAPPPTNMAVCAPRPSPPYFTFETNALQVAAETICVKYPDMCDESGLKLLDYVTICGFQGCNSFWMDLTTSVNTTTNTICGRGFRSFVVAEPIADKDGDGYLNTIDCNDKDNTIYPGRGEVCDDQKDNNCDLDTDCNDTDCASDIACLECTDNDGDGYAAEGGACGPIDCDDNDQTVYPGVPDICDTKDNDCDPSTADGSAESWIGIECDGADSDICSEGVYICSGGKQLCNDYSGDDVEICDYEDNDCDGFNVPGITIINPTTFKKCLGIYAIESLEGNAVYMQNYFYGELSCYDSDNRPPNCSAFRVDPAAWEMGTSASCAGPAGNRPDFMMGGHRCEYYTFLGIKWGKTGYWKSDSDYKKNSDSFVDVPAHASINKLSTGTCVDYSFALTTILRKLGYSKDEVFSVNGDEHAYNLVKFPGETKWNYVDTVGNNGGGVYGPDFAPISGAWYDYCRSMDKGCSNDYYSESRSHCPSNNQIHYCEGVPR